MNDLQKTFKDMIVMAVAGQKNLQEYIIDKTAGEIKGLPMFSALSEEEISEVLAVIKSEFSVRLDKGILLEEKSHEKWFLSKKSELDMNYWERYRKYLLTDKKFSANVVNKMDDILDTLTDLLGDPSRNVSFLRRGLIIGDVQSGKTANYTGLICKAADAGYKVIVLLTGTLEKLRKQTQQRIDEGFVGSASDAMIKQNEDRLIIGAGKYDSSVRPMVLTSTLTDFKSQNANNLGFDLRGINVPVIFVIKKNVTVLKRLNKWLKTFNSNGNQKIEHSLLVIDDEADNASVNTKANPEDTPTAINGQIRELVSAFSRSSYVGFTATPFANIFIDPETYDAMTNEDLFPKDYIYSLNAPTNYTGARNIFCEGGNAEYMLVQIDDDERNPSSIAAILPLKHKSNIIVRKLPEDLKTAIAAFLLANTIEDIEGINNNHRSMLINVSRFTKVQDQVAGLVNEYLKNIQSSIRNYAKLDPSTALKNEYIAKIKETYEQIYKDAGYNWTDIQDKLYGSCAGIVVQTFNKDAGQNVSYEDYKEGLRIIAVGGMSLSRGLTLEGLVISYFYRNSKMYDTLMQMGRWFGYRSGYDRLCRIFMSEESIEWYRYISEATDELRKDIKRYEDTGLTPMDFGLRVRSDITALLVTARNKMRSAETRECLISLSGVYIETPDIYSDDEKNRMNTEAVRTFVKELTETNIQRHDEQRRNSVWYGFKNCPSYMIVNFLTKLEISPKNEQFNVKALTDFISNYAGTELRNWDVAFVPGASELPPVDFGYGIKYHHPYRRFSLLNDGKILRMLGARRRIGNSADGQFGLSSVQIDNIKQQLKSQGIENLPQKAYFQNIKRNPLLTIYVVELQNPDNELTNNPELKKYQGKIAIGFGVGIPDLSDQKTKYVKYTLNKIALQQIFDGDIDLTDDEEGDD